MFELKIGDVIHCAFNGDSYPYIVSSLSIYRKRIVADVLAIPSFLEDGRQVIPKFDMFKGESANTLLIPSEELLPLLVEYNLKCDREPKKIIQSRNRSYWHDLGDPKPTFNWYFGMSYSQNPHI